MNRYALVIGVSEYQSSHLKKLPKAATDAEAVAKVLDTYGNFQQVERLPKRWNNEINDWEVAEEQGKSISNPIDKRIVEQSSYSHYS
jgi:hypothetical protein